MGRLTCALSGPSCHAAALAMSSNGRGAAAWAGQVPSDEWTHAKQAVRTKVGAPVVPEWCGGASEAAYAAGLSSVGCNARPDARGSVSTERK